MKPNQISNKRDVTAKQNDERHYNDDDRRNNPSRRGQYQNDFESNRDNMPNLLQRPQQLDNYLQQQWIEALQRQQNLRNNEPQQQQQQQDFMSPHFRISQSFQYSNSFQVQQWQPDGWQGQQQQQQGNFQQSEPYRNQGWPNMNQEQQQQQQQMNYQRQLQQEDLNQYQSQNNAPFQYQQQQNFNFPDNPREDYRAEGNNFSNEEQRFSREELQNRRRDNRYLPGENRGFPDSDDIERFGGQCAPDRNRFSPNRSRYPNDNDFLANTDRCPPDVDRYQPNDERNFPNANRFSPPASRYASSPGRHFSQARSRSPVERHYSAIAEKYSPDRSRTSMSPRHRSPETDRSFQSKPRSKLVYLPPLGTPGGLDDPNRRGLSGAGVKWYLRYLRSGMHPDLAREKVDERRSSAANVLNSSSRRTSIVRDIRDADPLSPERKRCSPERKFFSPTPEKPTSRRTRTIPAHGRPGGPDDPNRVGLSGAGVKWYLRYLESGLPPDIARAKVEERRKFPRPVLNSKELKSEPNFVDERDKPSSSARSENKLANRVAVLPKNFPNDVLTRDELTALQEDILIEVAKGWSHKIMFDAVHFEESMIVIDCADGATADWLAMKVPQLANWQERSLTTRTGSDIPLPYTITVFLPRSLGSDQSQLLTLIDAQNEGLNVGNWRVLSLKEQGKGQLMVAGIDERSKNTIVRLGHSLRYRFGKVAVLGLKAADKKA